MRTLFSTADLHPRDSFRRWQETLSDRGVPINQTRLDDGPFAATLEAASVGPLVITRISQGALRSETTRDLIRSNGRDETVAVVVRLKGVSKTQQDDRDSVQRPGDLYILDNRPSVLTSSIDSQSLFLELPRQRLESVLGSARTYTALTVGAELASTRLALTFIQQLLQVHGRLEPDSATRLSGICVDLIVASLAERMAKDVPRPLHGTIVVQRAKAYVEGNLGDMTLDPPQLAAAVGVSLRRLQELFSERGQHISDWIWQRRLEAAAQRLADPGCAHLPVGSVSYGCGFANQAHFARRFKERHGLSPRAYRQAALLGTP